jgi:hypothetical protein
MVLIKRRMRTDRAVMEQVESRQLLSGTVTPKFVAVPIDSAALSADPSLANFKTFDLQVTVTGTNHWTAGQLLIKLKTGSFYLPSGASNTPEASIWSTKANLKFHNFVSASNFTDPTVLGGAQTGEAATISSNEFSVAWGAINDTTSGTFTIARITMSTNANGNINGKTGSFDQPGVLPTFSSAVPFTGAGASITGYTWNDTNGDGGKNNGEVNMGGVQLYIDTNVNGKLDPGEMSVRSRSNGNYTFSHLAAGSYRIRENTPAGFRRTLPSDKSFWSVTLIDGAAAAGKRFGNTQRAQVTGLVWLDKNRDKVQQGTEPGLKGFTVWADVDGDGVIDSGETKATTSSNGGYTLNLGAGSYIIRILAKSGYKLTTPSGVAMTLPSGASRPGVSFGERKV